MKANELIERALITIGVLSSGETPDASTSQDCLNLLNDMVDQWGAERLTLFTTLRSVQNLSASTADYTIGTGGTFNITRPEFIEAASIILDKGKPSTSRIEVPIQMMNTSQWREVGIKGVTSTYPTRMYYDRANAAGLATISVWPVPTGSDVQLVLYVPQALSEFADLTTDYSFPKGYRRALHYKLAETLAPDYGRPWPPDKAQLANRAFGIIKEHNARPFALLKVDSALVGSGRGAYNWRTDQGG